MLPSKLPSVKGLYSQLVNNRMALNNYENNLQRDFNKVQFLKYGCCITRTCDNRQCFVKVNTRDNLGDNLTLKHCDHPDILKYDLRLEEEPFRFPLKNWSYLYVRSDFHDKSLSDWRDKNNSREKRADYIISIFDQIVKNVEYIYCKNLIHRNLKPENIFIFNENKNKLGLKIGLFGTRARNKLDSNYDNKVNIYSLGLIIREIVTWESKENLHNTLLFKLGKHCPKEFAEDYPIGWPLLEKMLSHKPDERLAVNDSYSQQLSKILEDCYDNIL
uniref:Protein kinase domain-containing protein n=1 Tax=Glossina brevipalpis TaxID=37001 RepID=A0A1A9W985_9MUSC